MNEEQILREISKLPPALQWQVVDFIHFLRDRYVSVPSKAPNHEAPVREEPFVGMWQDRSDLSDSTQWVRNVRAGEWGQSPG